MSEHKFTKRQYKILNSVKKDSNLDNIMCDYGYSGCDDYIELYNTERFTGDTFDFSDNRYDKKTEIFLSHKTKVHCDKIRIAFAKEIIFIVFSVVLTAILTKVMS